MRQHNVVECLCHVLLLIAVTFITNTSVLCSHPVSERGVIMSHSASISCHVCGVYGTTAHQCLPCNGSIVP